MFGLAPWMLIGWLITAAAIPLAYQGGYLKGEWHQEAIDTAANELAQAQALTLALQKQADDNAKTLLKQVEATQREREGRKAIESKTIGLENEAIEREKRLAEFICPAIALVTPPAAAPAAPGSPAPAPVVVAPRCDPSLSGDDLDWLRRNFPPGRVARPAPAASSGRGH